MLRVLTEAVKNLVRLNVSLSGVLQMPSESLAHAEASLLVHIHFQGLDLRVFGLFRTFLFHNLSTIWEDGLAISDIVMAAKTEFAHLFGLLLFDLNILREPVHRILR